MFINNFDPVAITIFSFELRWYSLSYIFGILIGWFYCKKITDDDYIKKIFDDIIPYLIIGILIGGRIGYVSIYNFSYYFNNPIEIFKIWNGGMSFHGGLIGIIFATYIFAKKRNVDYLKILDLISCAAPIGIFFGRISNYINSELYGRVTDVFWSVKFVKLDNLNRHPSQIYEAFTEGVLLFLIIFILVKKKFLKLPGLISSIFLIYYSLFRIFCEFFREPDYQVGVVLNYFTIGQILSLLMLSAGVLLYNAKKK